MVRQLTQNLDTKKRPAKLMTGLTVMAGLEPATQESTN
ncbi:hypothetical protein FQV37_2739 [Psychrobacter nivimaris]|uniref:Uncharacterized protein n=1 Tax=Psychrobacter nivimaris TaxID=281738 RepID=A0A6N7C2Y8_9GAMM|nr:hypothetical protein FQV37_2739 [Psychrobacter nivimaris]